MFSPGDKVRCIQPKSSIGPGFDLDGTKEYEVEHQYTADSVKLKGKHQSGFLTDRFVLLTNTPRIKNDPATYQKAGTFTPTARRVKPGETYVPLGLIGKTAHTIVVDDPVSSPPHYTKGGIEVYDFIKAWDLDFTTGNVIKYVVRAPHKGKQLEDLKKARWYLDQLIKKEETK